MSSGEGYRPCELGKNRYFLNMNNEWREQIRSTLKERNISLRQFGLSLGKSESYMKVLLHNKTEPGITTLIEICDKLEIPLSSLIDGIPEDPEVQMFAREFAGLSAKDQAFIKDMVARLKSGADSSD